MAERAPKPSALLLRPMGTADVSAVMAVQAACYGDDLLEPVAVLHDRLRAAGDTCWVALREGRVCAYLAAYRSRLGAVTPLHGAFEPAVSPDTLYLHDLAVHPDQHGTGLGGRLVDALFAIGRREGLRWSALVAVQGAVPFWQRLGYAGRTLAGGEGAPLLSYGGDAHYMVRPLNA